MWLSIRRRGRYRETASACVTLKKVYRLAADAPYNRGQQAASPKCTRLDYSLTARKQL